MNQLLFSTLISIVASMFFGIVSNWIYDLLRNKGIIPDKANLKAVVIILLVSLVFIILTIPETHLLDRLTSVMIQKVSIYFWQLSIFLFLSLLIGFFIGQKKSKGLLNKLRKVEKRLNDCEKDIEQSSLITQQTRQNGIINPK